MLGPLKLASVLTAILLLTPALGSAQPRRSPPPARQPQETRPRQRAPQNQPGHAGNWLRRYKDVPPEQQRRLLESDPQFRRLPPPRQAQMLRQLRIFSSLP